jgi:NADPH:quinone reductase-like Zn-dependent oxidoreductase
VRAAVVDTSLEQRIVLREVPPPVAGQSEAIVQVASTSLNYGEVRRALTAAATGFRPGWDVAGTIMQAAADGSGFPAGTRVVGFVEGGAWSEQIAVASRALAKIPDAVTFAQAATLPVGGLTAYYALAQGGLLLAKKVLIAGASGGVGHLACQMARHSGATVIGAARRADVAAQIREDGAHEVAIGEGLSAAGQFGPFDVILESVGGDALGQALALLGPDGVCITFGESAGKPAAFDPRPFFRVGGARLYGLFMYEEVQRHPPAIALGRLLDCVAAQRLKPRITVEADWTDIAAVARQLLNRKITGKAVIHMGRP